MTGAMMAGAGVTLSRTDAAVVEMALVHRVFRIAQDAKEAGGWSEYALAWRKDEYYDVARVLCGKFGFSPRHLELEVVAG